MTGARQTVAEDDLVEAVDNLGAVDVEITPADQERIDAPVPPCGVAVRY
jgi:hypothetical protein